MKAKIEKIKEKFGVGNKDEPETEPIVSENYGYSSYTFETYKNGKLAATLTTSDFNDWKEDILYSWTQLKDNDKITIAMVNCYPENEDLLKQYYKGTVGDFKNDKNRSTES